MNNNEKNNLVKILNWDYYQDSNDVIRPLFYFGATIQFLLKNIPNSSEKLYDYNGNRLDSKIKQIILNDAGVYSGTHKVSFSKTNIATNCTSVLNDNSFFMTAYLYDSDWKGFPEKDTKGTFSYEITEEDFDPEEGFTYKLKENYEDQFEDYKKNKKIMEKFDPEEGFDLSEIEKKNKEIESKKKHKEEEMKLEDDQEENFVKKENNSTQVRENYTIIKRGYDKFLTLEPSMVFIVSFLTICFFVFTGSASKGKK